MYRSFIQWRLEAHRQGQLFLSVRCLGETVSMVRAFRDIKTAGDADRLLVLSSGSTVLVNYNQGLRQQRTNGGAGVSLPSLKPSHSPFWLRRSS